MQIATRTSIQLGILLDQINSFAEAKSDYEEAIRISQEAATPEALFYGAVAALLLGTGLLDLGGGGRRLRNLRKPLN